MEYKIFCKKSQLESHKPRRVLNLTRWTLTFAPPTFQKKRILLLIFLAITYPSIRRTFWSRTSASGWSNGWNFNSTIWQLMRTWHQHMAYPAYLAIGKNKYVSDWLSEKAGYPTEVWKCDAHAFNQWISVVATLFKLKPHGGTKNLYFTYSRKPSKVWKWTEKNSQATSEQLLQRQANSYGKKKRNLKVYSDTFDKWEISLEL